MAPSTFPATKLLSTQRIELAIQAMAGAANVSHLAAENEVSRMFIYEQKTKAQGLLQHLAINHTAEVWHCFRSWLRTMNPAMPPSELVVANALRSTLPVFLAVPAFAPDLTKMMLKYCGHDRPSEDQLMAA